MVTILVFVSFSTAFMMHKNTLNYGNFDLSMVDPLRPFFRTPHIVASYKGQRESLVKWHLNDAIHC